VGDRIGRAGQHAGAVGVEGELGAIGVHLKFSKRLHKGL
jgi:hypothetical protein